MRATELARRLSVGKAQLFFVLKLTRTLANKLVFWCGFDSAIYLSRNGESGHRPGIGETRNRDTYRYPPDIYV